MCSKLVKFELPVKLKDAIVEDLAKYGAKVPMDNIYLNYDEDAYYGMYNIDYKRVEIKSSLDTKSSLFYITLLHEKVHEAFNKALSFYTNIEIYKEDKDLKMQDLMIYRFDELFAYYISKKCHTERLINGTYVWELDQSDIATIEHLNQKIKEGQDVEEAIKEEVYYYLESVYKYIRENSTDDKNEYEKFIYSDPLDKDSIYWLNMLEAKKDMNKVIKMFCEKYFPDMLK